MVKIRILSFFFCTRWKGRVAKTIVDRVLGPPTTTRQQTKKKNSRHKLTLYPRTIYSIHSYARFFYNHSESSISVINIAHVLLDAIGEMPWKKMVMAHCSHYHKQINTQPCSFQIVRINSPPYMTSPPLLKITLHCSNDGHLPSKRKERRSRYNGRVKDMNSKVPLRHFYYYFFWCYPCANPAFNLTSTVVRSSKSPLWIGN